MACLVDSLEFLKDDIPQRTQALEHLADMCLQGMSIGFLSQKVYYKIVFLLSFIKLFASDSSFIDKLFLYFYYHHNFYCTKDFITEDF